MTSLSNEMTPEEIIKASIDKAKEDGLAIVRGPVFVYEGDKLIAVDCFGAVMYANGYHGFGDIKNDKPPEKTHNPNLWIYKLFKILGKDGHWWSRYHFGFHHKKQLIIETQSKDKDGKVKKVKKPCGLSKKSWKLSEDIGSIDYKEFIASRRK